MSKNTSPPPRGSIAHFANTLRSGSFTCKSSAKWYLDRIAVEDHKLKSFVHVDRTGALATATDLDNQLDQGVDLGPLMGAPIAVKDIITVDGMPTQAGSLVHFEELFDQEGDVIGRLKSAGCIVLGKNRTIELAAGAHNLSHPAPWNPCNLKEHYTVGGSSNGSAVSVAAGLCLFALGTDTGGSVRLPAAMCSQFGFKPSHGLWPCSGVLPLCKDLDTLGLITRSAQDAAIIYGQLSGTPAPPPLASINGIRLGVPTNYFFDDLDSTVAEGVWMAISKLKTAGISFEKIELAKTDKVSTVFSNLVAFDLLNTIGEERFQTCQHLWDPTLRHRLSSAKDISAQTASEMRDWLKAQRKVSDQALLGLDGFITPTSPILPRPIASIRTLEHANDFTSRALQNTRPANVFDYCAATLPLISPKTSCPVGLQLHKTSGQDSDLLSLCQSIEPLISS